MNPGEGQHGRLSGLKGNRIQQAACEKRSQDCRIFATAFLATLRTATAKEPTNRRKTIKPTIPVS